MIVILFYLDQKKFIGVYFKQKINNNLQEEENNRISYIIIIFKIFKLN